VLCVSGQAAWSSFGAEYFAVLPLMSFDDRLYLARQADRD